MSWKKNILNAQQEKKMAELILQFENKTQTELAICIAKKCDPYPAATLRFAFLFMLTLSCVTLLFIPSHSNPFLFLSLQTAFFLVGMILGHFSYFKSLCLSAKEVHREVDEKAFEIFCQQELYRLDQGACIFIITSSLERTMRILINKNLSKKVSPAMLDMWAKQFSKKIKQDTFFNAFTDIITEIENNLEKSVEEKTAPLSHTSQICNKITWLN
ncbi:MAG: hypothetical protein KBD63_01260 [Bacteriovoracaceae bacterium]|nr:hypothetical protein [Bacteriovoracaceae bacterium]